MFKWAQQQIANVAGTKEPIYGSEAIKNVSDQAKEVPFTEIDRDGLKWAALPNQTSVETQVFYLMADNGYCALAQVIYSNVAGIRVTCQFNTKVFYMNEESKPPLWCSNPLTDVDFSDDMTCFYAQDCAVELTEDGKSYTVKSMTDERAIVNLKITRTAPAFVAGKDGKTLYGEDLANPWGCMRHAFWPRCVAEGTITTAEGSIDFKGKAFFAHALQGMKPHHAAAKWNFVDFQGPTYSAIIMEFTTPPSYGSTLVTVGGIAKDGDIVCAGVQNTVTHTESKADTETDWPAPTALRCTWAGTTKDGKPVEASMEGPLEKYVDRIDVMAEVPGFVKQIVSGAAGTRPYIYQYVPRKNKHSLKLKIGDQPEIVEEGDLLMEATFISE